MSASSKQSQVMSKNYMIVFVLISLLVVGVTVLAGKALVTSIIRDNKVVSAKSAANRQLKADLVSAPELVDSFSALGNQAGLLADALPNTSDLPSLIVVLENMGNDSGLTLKSVAPTDTGVLSTPGSTVSSATVAMPGAASTAASDPTVAPPPQPYEFSVNFSGTYGSLQKFLADIEVSARPMRVVGVQITGTGSSLSGEIEVETFYQATAVWPFGTETIK
jgi:Tfp pilus assembly protein PilO